MDKVRYAGDLSQEEAPEISLAFPETEPIIEEESDNQSQAGVRTSSDVTCKQTVNAKPKAMATHVDQPRSIRNG